MGVAATIMLAKESGMDDAWHNSNGDSPFDYVHSFIAPAHSTSGQNVA